MDFLSYFALGIIIFVFLTLAYGLIAIHDIPYNIAKARKHPHQDAIHTAGWVSLFTLHAIWPFLWIWATIYRPERGYGFSGSRPVPEPTDAQAAKENKNALHGPTAVAIVPAEERSAGKKNLKVRALLPEVRRLVNFRVRSAWALISQGQPNPPAR